MPDWCARSGSGGGRCASSWRRPHRWLSRRVRGLGRGCGSSIAMWPSCDDSHRRSPPPGGSAPISTRPRPRSRSPRPRSPRVAGTRECSRTCPRRCRTPSSSRRCAPLPRCGARRPRGPRRNHDHGAGVVVAVHRRPIRGVGCPGALRRPRVGTVHCPLRVAAMKRRRTSLTARDRRALAIGAAMTVFVLVVKAAPAGARAARSLDARAQAAAIELRRGRELLASEALMRDSLAVRAAQLVALAPRLVAGATAADARAELAALVTLAAERHQVRITRHDERPDSARAGRVAQSGADQ